MIIVPIVLDHDCQEWLSQWLSQSIIILYIKYQLRRLPDLFTEFITNIDIINVTVIDNSK